MEENQNQPVQEEVQAEASPVEEAVAPVVEPELTAETPAPEVPEVEAEIAEAVGLDRSIYNCPDCSGEGLKDEYHVCRRCNGTGKI